MHVRNLVCRLHWSKTPSVLFKFDIRKAFNSVKWEYILDLLQWRGFPSKFRDCITTLLCSSSSRILLNGVVGSALNMGGAFVNGAPSSPSSLSSRSSLYNKSSNWQRGRGSFTRFRGRGDMVRSSLYVDDVAVFMSPIRRDIDNHSVILKGFGKVTDVCTNFHKSSVVPICCNHLNMGNILQSLSATRTSLPLRYLGQLKKVDLQFH